MNHDLARADDFETPTGDDDRRPFVDADAQQSGIRVENFGEVILSLASDHMLVNRRAAHEAKAEFVPFRHHDRVAFGSAAHQI